MKKIISILLLCVFLLSLPLSLAGCGDGSRTLVVYNWEEYMDESILDEFIEYYKAKTGEEIDVVYSTYDTNETMLTKYMNGDANIDIMCPSEYAIEKLLRAGRIEKINKDSNKYGNLSNVNQIIYDKVEQTFSLIEVDGEYYDINDYFVPYMWGTLGILYNADVISEEDALTAGWGLLWNDTDIDGLDGNIYMKDSIRDAYAAGVLYAKQKGNLSGEYVNLSTGELINNTSTQMLESAEKVLREQKEVLKGYEVDFGKSDLARGVGYVNLAWSGDALYAIEDLAPDYDINLAYFTPEIGANVWFDGWVIPKESENKDIAHEFINFLCSPEISMTNAVYIGYTSAIDKEVLKNSQEALSILEENDYDAEEFFESTVRYPDVTDTSFGVMQDFGDKNETLVTMWERVKASGDDTGILLITLFSVIGIWCVLIGVFVIGKKGLKRHKIR